MSNQRYNQDWLKAFVEYASFGEAPLTMYFWVGVSAVAGALRRRVWIDQGFFRWLSNFYIVLVAPPGIVAKSTTASIGMNLLREVPGIKFGPDVVTWQALVQSLAASTEMFPLGDKFYPQSAITIESSEFGNFLNPNDREMVDVLVSLWDGKQGAFTKITKTQGSDEVVNPWVNIVACTTPAWIAGNFPEYMIGGGFTSRCIFVYAEEKRHYVAYPSQHLPPQFLEMRRKLIADLERISMLAGPYEIDQPALKWGEEWYERHYKNRPPHLNNERFGGYIARKQTHIHKLAMVMAASKRDELVITLDELKGADQLVSALEIMMPKVFAHIGRTENSRHLEQLLSVVKAYGEIDYSDLFRHCIGFLPSSLEFDNAIRSLKTAGFLEAYPSGNSMKVRFKHGGGSTAAP